jgi:hypothetical protein
MNPQSGRPLCLCLDICVHILSRVSHLMALLTCVYYTIILKWKSPLGRQGRRWKDNKTHDTEKLCRWVCVCVSVCVCVCVCVVNSA